MATRHTSMALCIFVSSLVLSGCNALVSEGTADIAGIAGGTLAGALTENAAAATGIGLAVRSVAAAGLDFAELRIQASEQQAIADAAGPLEIGEVAVWSADSPFVTSSGTGEVSVARAFGLAETMCKEIIFSVDYEIERQMFVTVICDQDDRWHWASAEPSTKRWGYLQ